MTLNLCIVVVGHAAPFKWLALFAEVHLHPHEVSCYPLTFANKDALPHHQDVQARFGTELKHYMTERQLHQYNSCLGASVACTLRSVYQVLLRCMCCSS